MSSKLPPEHEGIRATHIVEETIFVGGQSTTIHTESHIRNQENLNDI